MISTSAIILSLLSLLGIIVTSIIGYFLNKTMDDLKNTMLLATETKSQLEVLKNDHTNKYESLTDKIDDLKGVIQDLTKEIKVLNSKK